MSDQYYYLLDGKELGPFSLAAITSLYQSGRLGKAVLRAMDEQAWRTPEELGFGSQPHSDVAPVRPTQSVERNAESRTLPGHVVQSSIPRARKSGSVYVYIVVLIILALIAGALWLAIKSQQVEASSHTLASARPESKVFTQTDGFVSLSDGRSIDDVPDGSYFFDVNVPDYGTKPVLEFRIDIAHSTARLFVKRHVPDSNKPYVDIVNNWDEYKSTDSDETLGTLSSRQVTANSPTDEGKSLHCVQWQKSTRASQTSIDQFVATVKGVTTNPEVREEFNLMHSLVAVCEAQEETTLYAADSLPMFLVTTNALVPGSVPKEQLTDRKMGLFQVQQQGLVGLVTEKSLTGALVIWYGRIRAAGRDTTSPSQMARRLDILVAKQTPTTSSTTRSDSLQPKHSAPPLTTDVAVYNDSRSNLDAYTEVFPVDPADSDGSKAIMRNFYVKNTLAKLIPVGLVPQLDNGYWTTSGVERLGNWMQFSMCKPHDCGSLSISVFINTVDKTMTAVVTDQTALSTDQVLKLEKQGNPALGLKYITCATTGAGLDGISNNWLSSLLEGNPLIDTTYLQSGQGVRDIRQAQCTHVK